MNGGEKKTGRVLTPIRADEIYSLQLLRAITGWGDSAMRAARASGLKPVRLHNRVFYRGCDVTNYIHDAADGQEAVPPSHRRGADDGR
jgi:hypothetical protein